MINHYDFDQFNEPFPNKLYIQELEAELATAENTIHEAEESFQQLRDDYHTLQEYSLTLQDILIKTVSHSQNFTDKAWIRQ